MRSPFEQRKRKRMQKIVLIILWACALRGRESLCVSVSDVWAGKMITVCNLSVCVCWCVSVCAGSRRVDRERE